MDTILREPSGYCANLDKYLKPWSNSRTNGILASIHLMDLFSPLVDNDQLLIIVHFKLLIKYNVWDICIYWGKTGI